jgi:hypothetical protein
MHSPLFLRTTSGVGHSAWLDHLGLTSGNSRIMIFSQSTLLKGKELFEMIDMDILLAKAIHEEYVRMRLAEGKAMGSAPAICAWEDLRADFREDSRRQAQAMVAKLRTIGCDIRPMSPGEKAEFQFEDEEIESMARMEHERWMASKAALGYVYGPKRDDAAHPPTHPDMVDYDKLDERTKDYDREPCRRIPELLGRIGYVVVRTQK